MSDYEIEILNRNVLIKIVKEQQEIINKTIEFVKEFIQEDYYEQLDEYITHFTWNTTKNDLLNILKGEDK